MKRIFSALLCLLLLLSLAACGGEKVIADPAALAEALYAADIPARVEYAAAESLAAINAYIPQEQVRQAAWQFFQGQCTLSEALLPLM